jgi:hypothetical protein
MKHLTSIQVEFLKEAAKWNDLSYDVQREYLQSHSKSKKKLTAKPASKKKSLDDIEKLIDKSKPFRAPEHLYHLTTFEGLQNIKSGQSIKPHKPRASDEDFDGVWLTDINNIDSAIETHMLPKRMFHNAVLLELDPKKLNNSKYTAGTNYSGRGIPLKPPFSLNDYLKYSNEIVYRNDIPYDAITNVKDATFSPIPKL